MGGSSIAYRNKAIRQEAMREQLANYAHLKHIYDCTVALSQPGLGRDEVQRLKAKADIHLRLLDKYLPSLKAIEVSESVDLGDITDAELDAAIRQLAARTGLIPPPEGEGGEGGDQ